MKTIKKILLALFTSPWLCIVILLQAIWTACCIILLIGGTSFLWLQDTLDGVEWEDFKSDITVPMRDLYLYPIWKYHLPWGIENY